MEIKLYNKDTFPKEIKNLLEENSCFLIKRKSFNDLKDEEYSKGDKIDGPERDDSLEERYNKIKEEVKRILEGKQVIGFHYTRLTDKECEKISKEKYLEVPSSEDFFYKKVLGCDELNLDAVELYSLAVGVQNKYKKTSKNPTDKNKISFSYLEIKKDDEGYDGIKPLLSSWGGEFLYRDCEDLFNKKNINLGQIGQPYQIELLIKVPQENIDDFANIILGEEGSGQGNSSERLSVNKISKLNKP